MDPSRRVPTSAEALRAVVASDQALSRLIIAFCEDSQLQRRLPWDVSDRLEVIWAAYLEVKQRIVDLMKLMPKEIDESFDQGMAMGLFAADRRDLFETYPEAGKAFALIEAERLIGLFDDP